MMNLVGIFKKYFGLILMGGSTVITNGYQFLMGNTPWMADLSDKLGGNMLVIIIVAAIAISFIMKILRVIFNGVVIAMFVGAIFFHEPVINYLTENKEVIQRHAKEGVKEVAEEVKNQVNDAEVFNGSVH